MINIKQELSRNILFNSCFVPNILIVIPTQLIFSGYSISYNLGDMLGYPNYSLLDKTLLGHRLYQQLYHLLLQHHQHL